jgi:hypothetical protein
MKKALTTALYVFLAFAAFVGVFVGYFYWFVDDLDKHARNKTELERIYPFLFGVPLKYRSPTLMDSYVDFRFGFHLEQYKLTPSERERILSTLESTQALPHWNGVFEKIDSEKDLLSQWKKGILGTQGLPLHLCDKHSYEKGSEIHEVNRSFLQSANDHEVWFTYMLDKHGVESEHHFIYLFVVDPVTSEFYACSGND